MDGHSTSSSDTNFWNLKLSQYPPREGDVYVLRHQTAGRPTSSQLQLLMVVKVGSSFLGRKIVLVADLLASELDFWEYEDIRVKSNLERLVQNPEMCRELVRYVRSLSSIDAAPNAFLMRNPSPHVITKLREGGHCLNPTCQDGYCKDVDAVYAFYPELRAGRSEAELYTLLHGSSPNPVLCPDCHGIDLVRQDEEFAVLWSQDRSPDIEAFWDHIECIKAEREAFGLTRFATRNTFSYMHCFKYQIRDGREFIASVGLDAAGNQLPTGFVVEDPEQETILSYEEPSDELEQSDESEPSDELEPTDFWEPHEPENPASKTSKRAIAQLRRQKFFLYRTNNHGGAQTSCSVCLDDFTNASTVIRLDCKHVFHAKCIVTWLEKSNNACPLCREKVRARGRLRRGLRKQQ